mmetsp:Transcript_32488/g.49716  ORF Transcript_32488/g.49716 Transcript_32488/m.49716 type:complete len:103 (-) Transcript_32488:25-333(-)
MKILSFSALVAAVAATGVYTADDSSKIACTANSDCTDDSTVGGDSSSTCCILTDTTDSTNVNYCTVSDGKGDDQTCHSNWVQGGSNLTWGAAGLAAVVLAQL